MILPLKIFLYLLVSLGLGLLFALLMSYVVNFGLAHQSLVHQISVPGATK